MKIRSSVFFQCPKNGNFTGLSQKIRASCIIALALIYPLVILSCQKSEQTGFLSSATLESDLWKVSPTIAGTLLEVNVREGDSIQRGQVIASIDSVPMVLKLGELQAGYGELSAAIQAREDEIPILQATHKGIVREFDRATKLVAEGAATAQRKDDLETQKATSLARISATRSAIEALRSKYGLLKAQEQTLRDQITRCRVSSPATGRVLTKYRNGGEASIPGRPLIEIGKTDTLWADFFIPQTELARFKLGQKLQIRLDSGNDAKGILIPAKLTWISAEAEFTPKGVQTREARNELVFRGRAMAANANGALKRGMPVEVWE
jgi:HlyD family secretion protein